VAVHPIVQRIIEKYRTRGQSYPVPLSNGRMNEVLKEVALLAGLTDNVVMRTTKGGKRVEETFPKWKLVTTHTARRSFAKNLYLTGFKLEYLSRVMGHKSLEQTVEYIGLDAIEKAAMLKEHWA
jgi:integrase